jgi:DNA phosphorothioation-associated DGQHR protein 1
MTDQKTYKVLGLKVDQPVGEFFLTQIPAEILLSVCYSIPAQTHVEKGVINPLKLLGVQRQTRQQRLKEIGRYIDTEDAAFPNSIILGVNEDQDGNVVEGHRAWSLVPINVEANLYELTIPLGHKVASVIDGQHRLFGFDYSEKNKQGFCLPCAVFFGMPRALQASLFATININQKSVDRSLAYQLFGADLEESDPAHWPPDLVSLYVARVLAIEVSSPFHGLVRHALMTSDGWQKKGKHVAIATLIDGIVRLISSNPDADRHILLSKKGLTRGEVCLSRGGDKAPLRFLYCKVNDRLIYEIVKDFFLIASDLLWKAESGNVSIRRTVGMQALFDVLRLLLLSFDGQIESLKIELLRSELRLRTEAMLSKSLAVNFSDDFFEASGIGRSRIRGVLALIGGLVPQEKSSDEVVAFVSSLKDRE